MHWLQRDSLRLRYTLSNSLCRCCRLGSPLVFLRGHSTKLINSLWMENSIDLNGPS